VSSLQKSARWGRGGISRRAGPPPVSSTSSALGKVQPRQSEDQRGGPSPLNCDEWARPAESGARWAAP